MSYADAFTLKLLYCVKYNSDTAGPVLLLLCYPPLRLLSFFSFFFFFSRKGGTGPCAYVTIACSIHKTSFSFYEGLGVENEPPPLSITRVLGQ